MREGWLILGSLILAGCGGSETPPAAAAAQPGLAAGAVSEFELEHGIGPVTEPMTLGTVDHEMAEAGEDLFELKCAACHKLREKYVGPALGDVTARRSPAFIMNMILNPQGMIERHPVVKQLLAEHLTFMPNQGLSRDEARQVVEYLRNPE